MVSFESHLLKVVQYWNPCARFSPTDSDYSRAFRPDTGSTRNHHDSAGDNSYRHLHH